MLLAVSAVALLGLLLQPANVRLMTQLAAIDHPNARSSHDLPTPRGGGLAVVLAAMLGLAIWGAPAALLWAVGLLAAIGLAEDVLGLPVPIRLGLQLAASAFVATTIASVLDLASLPLWLLLVLIVGWLVGFVNVFNFMDGINGISSIQVIVAGLAFSVLGVILASEHLAAAGLILAVAAATFLPWNALRARIFLGDVGSYGLGAALGVLAVYALIAGAPVEAALAPLALYLTDTTWTLVRRMGAGEPMLSAHRSHVYQRLVMLGWCHQRVAAVCGVLTVTLTVLSAASLSGSTVLRAAANLVAFTLLAGYLAMPLLLQRRRSAAVGRSQESVPGDAAPVGTLR